MNRLAAACLDRPFAAVLCVSAACHAAAAWSGVEPVGAGVPSSSAPAVEGMRPAKGFVVTDGEFRLRISGWAQFRYLMNFRDNPAPDSGGNHDSGFASGFETAKTRLQAAGTVLDPNLRFRIEGEFSRTSGEFGLLDAWSSYTFTDGWLEGATIRGGQFKMPLLREQLVPDTAALTMERSVVDSVFSQGRSQGVDARWQDDRIRLTGGLGDGIGSLNTRYTSSSESDVALTGRMEFKWGDGDWVRFEDSPGWKLSPYAGMAGVAFHWQHSGNTATPGSGSPGPVSQSDLLMYTADVTSEGDGWSVFASFVGSHLSGDNGAPGFDDFGLVAQGAMFLTGQDEVFVRWDTVFPDGNRTGNDPFNTLTAGYNHFFVPESHALKFTADVCWFLDSTTSNSLVAARLNGRNGLLADSEGNQFCVRFQLQMMF